MFTKVPKITLLVLFFFFLQNSKLSLALPLDCGRLLRGFYLSLEGKTLKNLYNELHGSGVLLVRSPRDLQIENASVVEGIFKRHNVQKFERKILKASFFQNPIVGAVKNFESVMHESGLGEFSQIASAMKNLGAEIFPEELKIEPEHFFLILEDSHSIRASSFHADQAVATILFQIHGSPHTGTEFANFEDIVKMQTLWDYIFLHRVGYIRNGLHKPRAYGLRQESIKQSVGGEEFLVTLGSEATLKIKTTPAKGFHRASEKLPNHRRIIGVLTFR